MVQKYQKSDSNMGVEIRLRRFWMFTKEKQMKRKYSGNDLKKIIKSLDKRLDKNGFHNKKIANERRLISMTKNISN